MGAQAGITDKVHLPHKPTLSRLGQAAVHFYLTHRNQHGESRKMKKQEYVSNMKKDKTKNLVK